MKKKIIIDEVLTNLDETGRNVLRGDGNAIGFFQQQLQQILAKTYDKLYPRLMGTQIVPVSTEVNTGAESFVFYTYDKVGIFKILANYGSDLPRSDVIGTETVRKLKSLGGSFGYNIQEIRAAALVGRALQSQKAIATRTAYEQAINKIAFNGNVECGLYGFLNYPNVPISDVPNDGTGSNTEWVSKTPVQILRDMNEALTEIETLTNDVHSANTLVLPTEQYGYINRTIYNEFSSNSIMTVFKSQNEGVTVMKASELKGAGTAGVDVMFAYERDINNLALHIPQPYETFPPQTTGLEIIVPAHARTGGVVFTYPLSANIKEGI